LHLKEASLVSGKASSVKAMTTEGALGNSAIGTA